MVHYTKKKPVASPDYREITAKDTYDGRPIEKYAFSDCILGSYPDAEKPFAPKDFIYDINVLPRTKQVELAAVIGFLQDSGWNQANKNMVRFTADYEEQVNLFNENEYLNRGVDFELGCFNKSRSGKQTVVSVYNPIMSHFFRNPFPFAVEREVKKYLLSGMVSNSALRTRKLNNSCKKIVSITRFDDIAKQLRYFADLNVMYYSPLDYWDIVRNGQTSKKRCNSTWFCRPIELAENGLMIPSFEIEEYVASLPSYDGGLVLADQLGVVRKTSYNCLKEDGLLDPPWQSKEMLIGEIESAQIMLECGKVHPAYATEIRKNCEKALAEMEEPKEESGSKKGANIHFNKERWSSMRSGMTP